MEDFRTELTALKDALSPVVAAHSMEDGTIRGDLKPDLFMADCWKVVREHQTTAARFAAFGVYSFAQVRPTDPLTVVDPLPRKGLARLFAPKRIVISNVSALTGQFETAFAQSMNEALHLSASSLVFQLFFWENMGNVSRVEIAATGLMTTWFVHKHALKAFEREVEMGM